MSGIFLILVTKQFEIRHCHETSTVFNLKKKGSMHGEENFVKTRYS